MKQQNCIRKRRLDEGRNITRFSYFQGLFRVQQVSIILLASILLSGICSSRAYLLSVKRQNLQRHRILLNLGRPLFPFLDNSDLSQSDFNLQSHNTKIIPTHVAFICDGNSRWAKQRSLPTAAGHMMGAARLVDLLEVLRDDGIQYCTFYAFSCENWKRSPEEIREIFKVVEQTARNVASRVMKKSSRVQIRIVGDMQDERIPSGLKDILAELQEMTAKHKHDGESNTLTVCLAINYGGRQDILQATQKLAQAIAEGKIRSNDVNEETLASYLSTGGIPDPDIIVRTSGESRLSNFLLWNCAYSELYMTDTLWPDFDQGCWKEALHRYQQRQRRFGSRTGQEQQKSMEPTPALSAHRRNGASKNVSASKLW